MDGIREEIKGATADWAAVEVWIAKEKKSLTVYIFPEVGEARTELRGIFQESWTRELRVMGLEVVDERIERATEVIPGSTQAQKKLHQEIEQAKQSAGGKWIEGGMQVWDIVVWRARGMVRANQTIVR